jgi:hypothetical protein
LQYYLQSSKYAGGIAELLIGGSIGDISNFEQKKKNFHFT